MSFTASVSLRGHWNLPLSSRLYNSRKPSSSYPNIRIREIIRRFLLSEHFYGTRLDADDQALFLQKNMRIKIYLKPQSRANSSSSSGHSGTSLPQRSSILPLHHDKGMFPVFFEAYGAKLDWAGLDDPFGQCPHIFSLCAPHSFST